MKILVIQQKMIGDVLTSSILFEHLRKLYPEAQLDYLINSHTKAVVENNPNIDNFKLLTPEIEKSKINFYNFIRAIRKEKYGIVIDVYSKLSSNLITLFSGAKIKISYHKHYSKFIYTHPVKRLAFYRTRAGLAIENRLELLSPLTKTIGLLGKPKIFLTDSEKASAKTMLISHGISTEQPIYMISVLGSSERKTYPFQYMAELIDCAAKETQGVFLFNYIPKQEKDARSIYNLCQPETQKRIKLELFGRSLREFMALLSYCEAIIGNEGGAINIAKALEIRTFSIFSPWIDKATWSVFEDDISNTSVHLKDYNSALYVDVEEKELKHKAQELYKAFKPSFFKKALIDFLNKKTVTTYENPNTEKLTALVITFNEIIHIEELIRNLSFANEIIVVDSFSTDGTFEKLKTFKNVKVVQNEFKNFANQKNLALSLATNDWILFVDADERISPAFRDDVLQKINDSKQAIVAFYSLFRYYFGKTPIRFSGFQTAKSYRLFRKSKCSYNPTKTVHENLIVDGPSGQLKYRLVHYSFRDYEHYKEKMKHYALLKAQLRFEKGEKVTFFNMHLKPIYRFLNHYILRLGILDGKVGYIISKLNAWGVKQRYRELKRLNDLSSK